MIEQSFTLDEKQYRLGLPLSVAEEIRVRQRSRQQEHDAMAGRSWPPTVIPERCP